MDLVSPFIDHVFMARALLGSGLVALAGAPLGLFLIERRAALAGDAIGHAFLPGAAAGAVWAGGGGWASSVGAALSGAGMFMLGMPLARRLRIPEDAGLGLFYLVALAAGILIARTGGASVDLDRLLFGAALSLDHAALALAGGAAVTALAGIALIWRPLVMDTLDPQHLAGLPGGPASARVAQAGFYGILALVLLAAFQALGALMGAALIVLPALAARFWARGLAGRILAAAVAGLAGAHLGLSAAYALDAPAGAAITLALAGLVALSALAGPQGLAGRMAGRRLGREGA